VHVNFKKRNRKKSTKLLGGDTIDDKGVSTGENFPNLLSISSLDDGDDADSHTSSATPNSYTFSQQNIVAEIMPPPKSPSAHSRMKVNSLLRNKQRRGSLNSISSFRSSVSSR